MDLRETVNKYLKRLKSGVDCFDAFYRDTSCYVEYMAKKYLHDRSFVNEVINDTYVKLWKSIDRFDETRNGYGLLCKIAKNTALRVNEIESRNKAELVASVDDDLVKDSYTMPDAEIKMDLYTAIQSLPEPDRTIVEERYIYDKTLQSIADKMGISLTAVYNKLKSSYKILKKLL